MRPLLLLLLTCLTLSARESGEHRPTHDASAFRGAGTALAVQKTPGDQTDPWFAEDKWKHYSFSILLTVQGQYFRQSAAENRSQAVYLSVPLSVMGLGLAKEVRDQRAGGLFSVPDLVWDGLGVLTGALILQHVNQ